ncbi:hypothetical protein Tco_0798087 [Tanacetum coccineum]
MKDGKSVNTKFDKTNGSQSFLCVTPLNKNACQKQKVVSKTEKNHVESKPVTLQTSPYKQIGMILNTNVIRPGMYKVITTQESQTNMTKSALSSTGMNATSSVRRPMSRDSYVKNSVLVESKNATKKEGVYVRKNKQPDNTFANVVSNKEDVIDVDVANVSKAKTLLYVSFMQNVLIFMAISLFVMYIMLKVLDITSLALDNFVMEIWKLVFVIIHVTYEIWKEMICSQADVILICILSPFLIWLLLHLFVLCPKKLQQSHGYGIEDCHILILVPSTILPDLTWLTVYQSSNMERITFVLLVKGEKARKLLIHLNWFQVITPYLNYFIWIYADQ